MSDPVKVPLSEVQLHEHNGTTRTKFIPSYEALILSRTWGMENTKVLSSAKRHKSLHFKYLKVEAEKARLSKQYAHYPRNKSRPLFDEVFPFDQFETAFHALATSRAATPTPAHTSPVAAVATDDENQQAEEETLSPEEQQAIALLAPLKGIGDAKALAVYVKHGVNTVEALAELSVEELNAVPGIGVRTAATILASAQDALLDAEE